MSERKLRVIIAKLGLDGHNRGVRVICAGLRDRGYEGHLHRYPPESPRGGQGRPCRRGVDAVGISSMVGAPFGGDAANQAAACRTGPE